MSADLVAFPIPTVPFSTLGAGKVAYLSNFTNLATAVSTLLGIGTAVTLVIDVAASVSADLNINAPITLARENTGVITVAAAKNLYVQLRPNVGDEQLFIQAASSSNIVFGSAVNPINVAWFTGTANGAGTTITNAANQIITSIFNNGGGTMYVPAGTGWQSAGGHSWHPNMRIVGAGVDQTTWTCTANAAMFTVGEDVHLCYPENITFDGAGHGGTWTLCTGAVNGSGNFHGQSVRIINFAKVFPIVATDVGFNWQMTDNTFDEASEFRSNSVILESNTPNTDFRHTGYTWVEAGDYIARLARFGEGTWTGEFAGQGVYGHNQVETQVIVGTAGGSATASSVVTAAGMTGSPVTVQVPLIGSDNTAALVAAKFRANLANDPNVSSFFHVGGTGANVQLIALDPAANDGTMNFSIIAGGSGVTPSATSTNTTAGTENALAHGFEITGAHGTLNFTGHRDEGFDWFYKNTGGQDLESPLVFSAGALQSAVYLGAGRSVSSDGMKLADRVFRDGSGGSLYISLGGDTIAHLQNFAGTGEIELTGRQPTNFLTNSIQAWWPDNTTAQIVGGFGLQMIRNAVNNTALGAKALVELMATAAFDQALLRIGAGVGRVAGAYYDFWREHAGTTTEPIGYLVIKNNQGGSLSGMSLNGGYIGKGLLSYSPTGGVGYMVGSGGQITQITSKSTGVTINTINGAITMINSSLADNTTVTFTVTNSTVGANDNPSARYKSGAAGSGADYLVWAHTPAAGSFKISVRNISGGALTDALVIGFENSPGAIA